MQFLIAFFFFFFTLTTNLTGSQNIIKVPLLFSEFYLNITSTYKNILLLYRSKSTFKAIYTYIDVFYTYTYMQVTRTYATSKHWITDTESEFSFTIIVFHTTIFVVLLYMALLIQMSVSQMLFLLVPIF